MLDIAHNFGHPSRVMSGDDYSSEAGTRSLHGSGNLSLRRLLAAFSLYALLSVLFFARGLVGQFTTAHFGKGADAPLMMWFLVWWPHAIGNGLNPFLTYFYWAPLGFSITWSTCIPLISLIAAPLTQLLGPIGSLNILCLASFPLAAGCAFLLCHYISRDYWASMLGGYIFGFSPFLLGQLSFGRLHTLWIFPVPLAAYYVARRLRGDIRTRAFVPLVALILVVEFLCAAEIFATMTLFGGMVLALGWLDSSAEDRAHITAVIVELAGSYLIVLLTIGPYLYYMLFTGRPYSTTMWSNTLVSADALNFLVPAPNNELGTIPWLDRLSARFNAGVTAEEVAYLSLPAVIIVVHYIWRHWREPFVKLMTVALLIMLVLSLGAYLVVEGHATNLLLPWSVLRVSVLENAMPARFCAYIYLIFAVVSSLWLSSVRLRDGVKIAVGSLVVISLLPNLSAAYWIRPANEPAFFRDGLYRSHLKQDETVLILPFWSRNDSMLWQAESRMYFQMAGGPGPWPAKFAIWPMVDAFSRQIYLPEATIQLRAYLNDHKISTLIVTDESLPVWEPLLATLEVPIVRTGGVSLYRTSLISKAPTKSLSALRADFDNIRFETLLTRVDQYLLSGGSMKNLTASNAVKLGLIPADELVGPADAPPEQRHPELNWFRQPEYSYGVILFVLKGKQIVIGIPVWYPDAKKLIEKYGRFSNRTELAPTNLASIAMKDSNAVGILAMSFQRDRLSQAVSFAKAALEESKIDISATRDPHVRRAGKL
jgi:hypothetical protein